MSKKNQLQKKIFFILIFFGIYFSTFSIHVYADVVPYQLLAPLPDENGVPQNKVAIDENYLQVYFRAIYRMGIALATGLAVLMIIMGGIEYITTDAIGGKEEGKERISNAILGLLLALSSYVILKTIDPNLVNVSLNIESVDQEALDNLLAKEIALKFDATYYENELKNTSGTIPVTNEDIEKFKNLSNVEPGGESEKILKSARDALKTSTCNVAGTNGGQLACAYSVNMIIEKALGKPINNSLSTIDMYQSLKSDSRFSPVEGGLTQSRPGDIIISPTTTVNGEQKTGHVGIINTNGGTTIISNSSKHSSIQMNHTASTWQTYYEQKQGLNTYIFRPN